LFSNPNPIFPGNPDRGNYLAPPTSPPSFPPPKAPPPPNPDPTNRKNQIDA